MAVVQSVGEGGGVVKMLTGSTKEVREGIGRQESNNRVNCNIMVQFCATIHTIVTLKENSCNGQE